MLRPLDRLTGAAVHDDRLHLLRPSRGRRRSPAGDRARRHRSTNRPRRGSPTPAHDHVRSGRTRHAAAWCCSGAGAGCRSPRTGSAVGSASSARCPRCWRKSSNRVIPSIASRTMRIDHHSPTTSTLRPTGQSEALERTPLGHYGNRSQSAGPVTNAASRTHPEAGRVLNDAMSGVYWSLNHWTNRIASNLLSDVTSPSPRRRPASRRHGGRSPTWLVTARRPARPTATSRRRRSRGPQTASVICAAPGRVRRVGGSSGSWSPPGPLPWPEPGVGIEPTTT